MQKPRVLPGPTRASKVAGMLEGFIVRPGFRVRRSPGNSSALGLHLCGPDISRVYASFSQRFRSDTASFSKLSLILPSCDILSWTPRAFYFTSLTALTTFHLGL